MPLPRFTNKARLFVILLTLFLSYWSLVPLFLPLPQLSVNMPAEAPIDIDVPITVRLDGWHSNFEIIQVRFYADYAKSNVDGPNGPFYPQILYQRIEEIHWPFTKINRFAFPRHREFNVTLPLAQLYADGIVAPGTVHGNIGVTLSYPDLHTRTYRPMGERHARTKMISVPFDLEFLPPSP